MRSTFGANSLNYAGSESSVDRISALKAASLDQIAVVFGSGGEIIVASPRHDRAIDSYEIDLQRLPPDFSLAALENVRRAANPSAVPLSADTLFLTAVSDFSERTRILALDGEKLALAEGDLANWLIAAEQQVVAGTDGHPLFETALEDTACTILRLPNGQVSMTEAPRAQISTPLERFGAAVSSGSGRSTPDLRVETPLRCVARYFLTALREGDETLEAGKEAEATAFILIGRAGFSYGLWSPSTGLFSEYAFLAPTEITRRSRTSAAADDAEDRLKAYVRHAIDQLFLQLSPELLERMNLSSYARIVWVADPTLSDQIERVADEYERKTGIEFSRIDAAVDEAIASGLLFGSFTFGDVRVAGAEIVPPVDLAHDLLAQATTQEVGRMYAEEARAMAARSRALFAVLAAPVAVLAILAGLAADLVRSQVMTTYREYRADARTAELKPALDRRLAYEANLKWYQEFITEVSRLRRQQPVGIGLLYQLNSNYPFSIDPSFYVSDMKLLPDGSLEMKGYTHNKDAIASFLKSLEFAGGMESGTRLFSNLAYEVQEAAPAVIPAAAQPTTLPTLTGSALTTTKAAPGVILWSIRGNYIPMAEFAPPPQDKPGVRPAPQTVQAQPAVKPAA